MDDNRRPIPDTKYPIRLFEDVPADGPGTELLTTQLKRGMPVIRQKDSIWYKLYLNAYDNIIGQLDEKYYTDNKIPIPPQGGADVAKKNTVLSRLKRYGALRDEVFDEKEALAKLIDPVVKEYWRCKGYRGRISAEDIEWREGAELPVIVECELSSCGYAEEYIHLPAEALEPGFSVEQWVDERKRQLEAQEQAAEAAQRLIDAFDSCQL